MLRLRRSDFDDEHELAKIAGVAGASADEFRREFDYLVATEPPPLRLDVEKGFVLDEMPLV